MDLENESLKTNPIFFIYFFFEGECASVPRRLGAVLWSAIEASVQDDISGADVANSVPFPWSLHENSVDDMRYPVPAPWNIATADDTAM